MEGVSPDEKEMKKFFPPTAIGYPWSKWATEQTLRKARDMGLPLCIYRLPNTNLSLRTGFTNRTDYLTALMVSSMQEGMFPIGATAAPFTPADTISEMLVEASFLENRKHWFYHLVDATVVTRHELERWSADMGVSYRGVQYQEFLNAVKERGRASPIHRFVPLMQHWRRYWFDSEERTEPLPISNKHIFEDLPNFKWPSGRDVFQASFMYSCEARFFMPNSKSIGMVADDMVALAKKNAGLDTLPHGLPGGDAFFTQPIRSLTDSAREDVKLSFFGQFALSRSVHQLLKNALFLQAMEQQHPDILRQSISQPLVIVGPDVLGNAFLQLLMAQDPSNRVPRFCEVNFPYGEDGSFRPKRLPNNAPWEQDPRMAAARRLLESSPMLGNEYTSILPRSGDMPDDDTAIFEHSLRAHTFCMGYGAPSYGEWLKASDGTEIKKGYAMHKRFLQHLQWQRAGDRWVLKMPAHMLALDALFETYPDARVIFLHRNPKVALGPVCRIVNSVREKLMDDADMSVTSHQQAELMAEMVNTATEFRQNNPALRGRFVDVTTDALVRDPVGTVRKIYRQCGLAMPRRASQSMWDLVSQHRDKRDQLFRQHEPLDQFGLDEDDLDEAFQPYYSETRQIQTQRRFSRLMPTCGGGNTIARRTSSQSGRWRRLSLPQSLSVMATRRSESYTVSIRRSESQRQDSK
uniref:Thioester reductase (TE) domain-containing protein n=1 Tax=Vitrella brassicaformis TaxID=1169539 RepID=A0A7S1KGP7_9ALVE